MEPKTIELWNDPHPPSGATFQRVIAQQTGDTIRVIRFWNVPNQPTPSVLSELELPITCAEPRWTSKPVWSNPGPNGGGTFEIVYGVSCGTSIFLIRFWNPRNNAQMVTILDDVVIEGAATGHDGWKEPPLWKDTSLSPALFDAIYEYHLGDAIHQLRFWNRVGQRFITVLS